ncbi:ABC transporter [Aurantiacibacter rhizosphaerae]|uniref:ABC transporter n=1 Tax=Aurantiacibacter rhizosphaerae TaxID=2691582 RepID=A0A844XCF8_9SPHN|nr:ABC transporter [Aurantiacibacter rhizosphaerae]MWV27382.1 ABC transporter [Aurantiacibacter rhizosphaerae]
MLRLNSLFAAAALTLCCVPAAAEEEARPEVALMGTVPIFWGEADGFAELLSGDAPSHWARGVLEEGFDLAPLDYLSADALKGHKYLLMAQPRGLTGEENVALDAWVRDGGSLLLFADPRMTGESRFHIGDRRRPQDVALLSPILAHWGLELAFDPAQQAGPHTVNHFGDAIPVNLRGELRPVGDAQYCTTSADGLLAHCAIGAGQVMIVADAAMLDIFDRTDAGESALRWLVAHIFEEFGDRAGNDVPATHEATENQRDSVESPESEHHHHHLHGGNHSQ